MLSTLLDIILALFAVYGGYCLYINLVYILFCRNKSKICLAYMTKENNNNFSEIFFAKKAFLGRSHVIILVECDSGDSILKEIQEKASGTVVYRAERIDGYERQFY